GIAGAFLAVPVAAAVEVILERLQARDVPIAQDPTTASVANDSGEEHGRTLPDSGASAAAR
ncbi:MAG: hypothetical protein QOH68_321, partial [Nocardioidaceae bacterium]|nr:hypothetical protein [Nocardioidaceae bacterium]